jgi:hypothetical protein
MIRLTQTRMKIHHASSIRPFKNKLFSDERKFNYWVGLYSVAWKTTYSKYPKITKVTESLI